jgi:transcriptional regulator with XRE-family HTH domain
MATHIEQNTMGKRIFLVRVAYGLTQGQFASFLGLSRQAVTAYESGQPVPLEVLFLLCDKFNVTWTWILTGNGPMYSSPDLGHGPGDTLLR